MLDQVPDIPPAAHAAESRIVPAAPAVPLVIDILARPPADADCVVPDADPFHPEIVVCQKIAAPLRLSKSIGPERDDFGNAIPQARLKLSDKAEAEANLINKSVGGWNANGAEVRLKIDF